MSCSQASRPAELKRAHPPASVRLVLVAGATGRTRHSGAPQHSHQRSAGHNIWAPGLSKGLPPQIRLLGAPAKSAAVLNTASLPNESPAHGCRERRAGGQRRAQRPSGAEFGAGCAPAGARVRVRSLAGPAAPLGSGVVYRSRC